MKLSIVIQAHPARRAEAEHLRSLVAGSRIVWDPDPDGPRDTWRTNRAAWSWRGHGGWTHRLLLQDDALPCPGFREAAERAVAAAGAPLLCFFVSQQLANLVVQMLSAAASGQRFAWAAVQGFVPMQALAMPRDHVTDLLEWTDANPHPGMQRQYPWLSRNLVALDPELHRLPNDDEIVARWARARGLMVCASVPSLVEHDTWTDSLIGNDRHAGRQAACLLPDGVDARSLDW